jgi:hypothetical protein
MNLRNRENVYKQIEQALENIETFSRAKQEKIRAILERYAKDEIGLDEAYYDLLEDELIPMPQRCAMSAKIPVTEEDEKRLKGKIKSITA